jgi:general secretion pathway protein G
MRAMRSNGFSLVELLAVLAILAVLAAMVMPVAQIGAERSREHELKRALWEIRDAIDAYHDARVSGAIAVPAGVDPAGPAYPPDLHALTILQPDLRPEHHGQFLRFLRRVPADPFADPATDPERAWGLRGYASEASHPQPGPEVYDVHTQASGTALDGTPLSQW